jgi:FMN reductase
VERVHQALALARHPAVAQVIVSSRSAVRATFQAAGAERMRCLA